MDDIRLEKRTIQERLIIAKTLIETALSDLPTAERKGKWMKEWRDTFNGYTHISGYKCTECDALYPWRTNYCPNCGSRNTEESE